MTRLQQIEIDRRMNREKLRLETLVQLRAVLKELAPADSVIVFGSVLKPGRFNEASDVDLALECEPSAMSIYQLTSRLAEHLGRSVDVVLLPECRFREKVLSQGERWTLQG